MTVFVSKATRYREGRHLGSQVPFTIPNAAGASAAFCQPREEGLLHQELQKCFRSWVSLRVLPHFWQVHKEIGRLATLGIWKTCVSASSRYWGNFKKLDLGMRRGRAMGWAWRVHDLWLAATGGQREGIGTEPAVDHSCSHSPSHLVSHHHHSCLVIAISHRYPTGHHLSFCFFS